MSTEAEQVISVGNLTCHKKTKTAGRKMLRCRTAPHKASTCEYSLFFITSGGAKISAASRPPAPGLQQDGRKQHGMAGTNLTESHMAWHVSMAWRELKCMWQ